MQPHVAASVPAMDLLRVTFPLFLSTLLAAQRVVVVDTNNGPGTDHTTLASAFAALLEGDVLLVRAGIYAGVAVNTTKSFVMLGEGNPLIQPQPTAMSITLSGSTYQRVTLRGITCHSLVTGQAALRVSTNYNFWPEPTVHLEDCQFLSLSPQADRIGLVAVAVGLTAQRCTMNTSQVSRGLASFVECAIIGLDQSMSGPNSQPAQTALDVLNSEVWIVDSMLQAGNSHGVYGSPASCLGFSDSTSTTTASRVHVSGSSSLGADLQPSPLWPPPFVVRHYQTWWPYPASFDYESGVTLVPSASGTIFSANVNASLQTVPSLRASTAPLGGAFTCTGHSDTNDIVILLAAVASHAGQVLGLPLLLDASIAWIAGFDVIGSAGEAVFAPIAIPNDQSLLGLVLEASSASLTPAGALRISNPVSGVVQ